jgi:hypothetical protein
VARENRERNLRGCKPSGGAQKMLTFAEIRALGANMATG